MAEELTLWEFVEQNSTPEELSQYREVCSEKPPATLWYFGIDEFRASHPGYARRYDLEQTFSARLAERIIAGELSAEGCLNGSLAWTTIDKGAWDRVRISALDNAAHLGVQCYRQVRLVRSATPSLHEVMVKMIEAFAVGKSPELYDREDFFEHIDSELKRLASKVAKDAAWKSATLDLPWREGGARRAKARRSREERNP